VTVEKQREKSPRQKRERLLWVTGGLLVLLVVFIVFYNRKNIVQLFKEKPQEAIPPACTEIGQTWTSPKDGMTLVCIPAGEFEMGAPDSISDAREQEKPAHKVFLDAFWIDKTEVTNAMFTKFVQEKKYKTWAETKRHSSYVFSDNPDLVWEDLKGAKWDRPEGPSSNLSGREHHPVVHIHKDDAIAYCNWAGRRLLSEAEWEKAARGIDGRMYPWGNEVPDGMRANLADINFPEPEWADEANNDGYRYTAPVGTYPKGTSPYGVLDMAGNVWELVNDWADWEYYQNSPYKNPQGPPVNGEKQLPVIRGSSWYGNGWEARSFHRAMPDPNKSSVVVGFRCATSSLTSSLDEVTQ